MTTWSLTSIGFEAELDILEVRLRTLDPVVDIHVIAEATRYYSGELKPLFFARNRNRFAPWRDKLCYVLVDDPPDGDWVHEQPVTDAWACDSARWARENHQRAALARGCEGMADDDLVLLSDLDEIPRPEAFPAPADGVVCRPRLALHSLAVGWRWPEAVPGICRFMRASTMRDLGGPQGARQVDPGAVYGDPGQPGWLGWHLSYMGGPEAVRTKLRHAAHHELDRAPFNTTEHILECAYTGRDLFGRPERECFIAPFSDWPPCVREDPGRYPRLTGEAWCPHWTSD